jgi:hypothetical protein
MQDRDAQQRGPHSGNQALRSHPGAVPCSSRMLTNYLVDIERLLCEHRWDAALREAFDLPQIAVALADPQLRSSSERAKRWCGEWVRALETDPEAKGLERVHRVLCERLDHGEAGACESVPARALRRLRLHRLTRTLPGGFTSEHPAAADAQGAGEAEICYALIEAACRWYADSACRDAQVQANLARLALLH